MKSNPPRLAKKAARKHQDLKDDPLRPVSTSGPSAGEDSSDAPSTRGPNVTDISRGGIVRPNIRAMKSARKSATDHLSMSSRHSTGDDDDSDPPSTRSRNLTGPSMNTGIRPISMAIKASRKVTFRVLPSTSRRSAVESDGATPSSHHGRMLASDDSTMHRSNDRADSIHSRTNQRRGQSQGTRFADQRARDLGYYRPSRSTTTIDILTAERRKWMSRHTSKEFISDGVTRQRVSRIATGRQSRQRQAEHQEEPARRHFRVSKRKSYLVEGKFVSPGPDGSSDTNGSVDDSEESTEEQPERAKVGIKAARKLQFGVKSGRPNVDVERTVHRNEQHDENLCNDPEEENMSLYDTEDHTTAHDMVDNDVVEEPIHRVHSRLPFLRRNVRDGFKYRCKMLGIDPNALSPPLRPISITYPCPPNNTEEQGGVPITSRTTVQSWLCVMCDLHGAFNNRTVLHKHLSWDHPEIDVKWNTDYSELLLLELDPHRNLATARPAAVAPPITEEDTKLKFVPSTERRTTPSVAENFGPTAKYPYLPESGDIYSCRPVLSWMIVDREEELFELDDVLDEDKVMLALWYRWIFLNRNKFIANYFNGAKTFVNENWKLIRQAAGIAALRTWLLVLCVNNFLLPLEVVSLMQFYQSLAEADNTSG